MNSPHVARLVDAYVTIIYLLLAGIPFVAIVLIGASYIWDVERGPGCDFSKEMLAFMGKVAIGYAPVVGVAIFGVPRIIALFKSSNSNGTLPE